LETSFLEFFIGLVIILDMGLIWMETDARAADEAVPAWAAVLQAFCTLVYIVELSVRFYVLRMRLFDSVWGIFDLVIVVLGVIEFTLDLLVDLDFKGIALLRVVRLFRLTRLLRGFKLFGALRELRKLLMMMAGCFKTLAWSFLVCFLIMSFWSIIAVEIINPWVQTMAEEGYWPNCEECVRSFTSVMRANMSFYQTVIAGDSWGKVAIPVITRHPEAMIVLVGAHATLIFGVLNLVVAVVVDNSAEMRQKDTHSAVKDLDYEELQERKHLRRIFEQIDKSGTGFMTLSELCQGAVEIPEFRHWLVVLDVDSGDLLQLFRFVDKANVGQVASAEFIEALYRLKHTESKTAMRFVKHIVTDIHNRMASLEGLIRTIALATNVSSTDQRTNSQLPDPIMSRSSNLASLVTESNASIDRVLSNQAAPVDRVASGRTVQSQIYSAGRAKAGSERLLNRAAPDRPVPLLQATELAAAEGHVANALKAVLHAAIEEATIQLDSERLNNSTQANEAREPRRGNRLGQWDPRGGQHEAAQEVPNAGTASPGRSSSKEEAWMAQAGVWPEKSAFDIVNLSGAGPRRPYFGPQPRLPLGSGDQTSEPQDFVGEM